LHLPDFVTSPPAPNVGFIHRSTERAEIYFIANTSNERVRTNVTLRVKGRNPEWWDPFTGKVTAAAALSQSSFGTVVPLELAPYGSRLLVFEYRGESGSETIPPATSRLPEPLDLSQEWDLMFEETAKTFHLNRLLSWTELKDLQFFSGRATYCKVVAIPPEFVAEGIRVDLNFGEPVPVPPRKAARFRAWVESPVREAAEVYVNDQRVGTIWRPPYELDVRNCLRVGENQFKVVVGNLAINGMAGGRLPSYRDLEARYGRRFSVQDIDSLQAVPSGLLGTIHLIAH
jgi:alpha-L-rhamnosidase